MYVHRTSNGKRIALYTCSAYSKVPVGKLCKTQHRVNEDNVIELIKDLLRSIAEYSKLDREGLCTDCQRYSGEAKHIRCGKAESYYRRR